MDQDKANILRFEFDSDLTLADIEREVILQTLHRNNENRTQTAKVLGIGIRTLQRKLSEYGYSKFSNQRNHKNK